MKRLILFLSFICVFANPGAFAQNPASENQRVKVFLDCHAGCDKNFIRTEINIVDFLLDPLAADVHILINDYVTGGGGRQVELIFFGQNQFKQLRDTLHFNTLAASTDFERRDLMVKYLKMGLVPYLARTQSADEISILMKSKEEEGNKKNTSATKDPWNYWVFKIGFFGFLNADEVYKSSSYSANASADRVTDQMKTGVEMNAGRDKTIYTLKDDNGNKEKIVIKNTNYHFSQYLVKSLTDHWSLGYELTLSRNTFYNNKNRLQAEAGVEYDILPYKQVNTKLFTLAYIFDVRRNNYYDSTLYDKINETLWGHKLKAKFSLTQKWGSVAFGSEYHSFLHNWKYFSLGLTGECDIRVTGGLSFNIYVSEDLNRDQLHLPKGGATQQEILTRRRQLASGYNFFIHFGVNYRFGSKLNNFVNPRFD